MLTRDQVYTMLLLRKREDNIFSVLPDELICHISDFGQDPNNEIHRALRLAVSGEEKDMTKLVEMVNANPHLLFQAGNVITRGGVPVIRTTLYEFFLGEGDPDGAKQIEFGFAKISNGENERLRQYERYRPHIEALAKQVESKQPALDLRPLIDIIKHSSPADITAALNKNMQHESALRDALMAFRDAVRPKRVTVGMHYQHYTTLQQALELLDSEWAVLSNNYTDYHKCRLVWRQIIGYLQRSLPAVDRFAFARAFEDKERTLNYKYENGSFPDALFDAGGDLALVGVGFDDAVCGRPTFSSSCRWARGVAAAFSTYVEQKLQTYRTYAAESRREDVSVCNSLSNL